MIGVPVRISASILSADFGELAAAVAQAEAGGADAVHIDVMDGHYVHNLTFGAKTVADLRPRTRLPLHVHLEIAQPEAWIADFAAAGADMIIVQADTCADIGAYLAAIRAAQTVRGTSLRAGLCLNPEQPLDAALPHLATLDLLLCLSVHPGFGGQAFQAHVLDKVRQARSAIAHLDSPPALGMDGGIHRATVARCVAAGADFLAIGSAIFDGTPAVAGNVRQLRAIAETAWRTHYHVS